MDYARDRRCRRSFLEMESQKYEQNWRICNPQDRWSGKTLQEINGVERVFKKLTVRKVSCRKDVVEGSL